MRPMLPQLQVLLSAAGAAGAQSRVRGCKVSDSVESVSSTLRKFLYSERLQMTVSETTW